MFLSFFQIFTRDTFLNPEKEHHPGLKSSIRKDMVLSLNSTEGETESHTCPMKQTRLIQTETIATDT